MKNFNLFLLLFLLLFICSTGSVKAQEQEEDEEDFEQLIQEFSFTEAVYLQEPHEFQVTLSYYRIRHAVQVDNSLSLDLEYGLTDWIQFSAELENNMLKGADRNYSAHRLELGTMVGIYSSPRQAVTFALDVEF